MSKQSNVNPDHYKQAGRERQGETIVHDRERAELERVARQQRREGNQPHIPNQERASTPRQPESEQDDENAEPAGPKRLTDDEGMVD